MKTLVASSTSSWTQAPEQQTPWPQADPVKIGTHRHVVLAHIYVQNYLDANLAAVIDLTKHQNRLIITQQYYLRNGAKASRAQRRDSK